MLAGNSEYWREESFGLWLEDQMEFPQFPERFRTLGSPWRVSDGVSQSETINKILEHSFEVQASRVSASSDIYSNVSPLFPESYVCTMNRQCIEISGLLQYYFSWLDIDAKVFCGTMTRSCKDLGKFHTFLEIEGEIIDNTYSCPPVIRLYEQILVLTFKIFYTIYIYLEWSITSKETRALPYS